MVLTARLTHVPSLFWLSAIVLSLCASPTAAKDLTDEQLSHVEANLADGAHDPWELGTRAQAVTELHSSSFSVFSDTKLPLAASLFKDGPPSSLDPVLDIAHTIVANRSVSNGGITGPQALMANDALGDPASIGVAVLLANWTLGKNGGDGQYSGVDYEQAAKDQLDFLFLGPRTDDGAISHRTEQVQLWSDYVYMVPPFLAYYGVTTGNQSLLAEAYNQCKLYRSYLRDESAGGLWKHIVLGDWDDQDHWSTGNGWAAGGMLRVLATIQHSDYADAMKSEQSDLATWVEEIHTAMYPWLQLSGVFRNYADIPVDGNRNFEDAASAALLAATVYRLAITSGVETHIADAERSRAALLGPNTNVTNVNSDFEHFTSDFWLTPVVLPYDFSHEGKHSPESQAFVLEMEAARRDWQNAGGKASLLDLRSTQNVRRYKNRLDGSL
ncbi:hypothetical protein OE88DRAFT_1657509 [Heliocybe sulcata]|uniref:Six-hairpin glycosidase n=1 Tax=Heliocybe sulcata TaxID=5364 RepID=A0A5C3N4V4_9AGAM|nr:hypothetical protein OE88DRAFT_1657509 [Heliocybe sulcata]